MAKLLLLFVLVPALELFLLIKLGGLIGALPTIGIIVVTGVLGASLTRWQGLTVLRQMQLDIASGKLPASSIVDGAIVLVAGALLLTPGFLTDIVGFACLVPAVRALVKRFFWSRLERAIQEGRGNIFIRTG